MARLKGDRYRFRTRRHQAAEPQSTRSRIVHCVAIGVVGLSIFGSAAFAIWPHESSRPSATSPSIATATLPDQPSVLSRGTVGSNVMFILADDFGVDVLEGYGEGDSFPPTPTIDMLRETGILFRNVYSNSVCSTT